MSTKKRLMEYMPWLRTVVEDSVDFISSELGEEFADAERYYNGETDLELVQGRSSATMTVVRDSIRNLKPSIMRTIVNTRKPIEYVPSKVISAAIVEQQTAYVTQLFYENNGYQVLLDSVDQSLKKKYSPVKVYWQEEVAPEFVRMTGITAEEVIMLEELPGVEVIEIKEREGVEDVPLYDVSCEKARYNGQIIMEAVLVSEFFFERNSRKITDGVHGHRRTVTVAEAIELGLEYDDWFSLDNDDPEQNEFREESEQRRQYLKRDRANPPKGKRGDVLLHEFLLTEVYVKLDLEDTGHPQLYCVWLGGTSYQYLGHDREGESPFEVIQHDPRPFTVAGTSAYEVTKEDQDVQTSLLRGMLDNLHLGNNPRIGANPAAVNFDDLTSWETGHPIRMKAGAQMQVVQVPSNLQSSLPVLQFLGMEGQTKIGVTKASQGLDPSALQSTDKNAVRNTIERSLGQVELMARNIVETGLIPIFAKLLRLSINHLDRYQVIELRGNLLPVDQLYFDPSLTARPNVGLGTASEEMRLAGLQFILSQQLAAIEKMGMANPMVTMHNVYNTLEDLAQGFGIHNVGRYFNYIDPQQEQQYAKQRMEMEAQNAPLDPGKALLQSEEVKAQVEKLRMLVNARTDAVQTEFKAVQLEIEDDRFRDKMDQEREIEKARLLATTGIALDTNEIKRLQAKPREEIASRVDTSQLTGAGDQAERAL